MLKTGQAQLVTGLTPREFDSLRSSAGVKVGSVTGNENMFIHMNFKTKPFDNVKLREAIGYAIPYDQIIKTGYFGQADQWKGFRAHSYPGYVDGTTQFTHDPAKARRCSPKPASGRQGLEAFADAFQLSYVAEKESTLGPSSTSSSPRCAKWAFRQA